MANEHQQMRDTCLKCGKELTEGNRSEYYNAYCYPHGHDKEMAYREKQNNWAKQDAEGY